MLIIMAVHALTVGHFSTASVFVCYTEFMVLRQLMLGYILRAVIGLAEGSVAFSRTGVNIFQKLFSFKVMVKNHAIYY